MGKIDIPLSDESSEADKIQLVIWDFDMTILRIHSFAKRITAQEIPKRDFEADAADANFLRAFLDEMKRKNVAVAIATFGKREVVETYLKHLLQIGKGDFCADFAFVEVKKAIVTPNDVGGKDGCSMKDKSRMLDLLTRRFILNENDDKNRVEDVGNEARERVAFFDDDEDNVNAAKQIGYKYAVHAPNAFTREAWREMFWKVPKFRHLFPEVDVMLTQKTRRMHA